MTSAAAHTAASPTALPVAGSSDGLPGELKLRLEDPLNRYYRYPVARLLVRGLVKTPITPNQVTALSVAFAALAGWLITFQDARYLAAGALMFEVRSILDCADGTLARKKNMTSPVGHAIDGLADWIGVVFLYGGILWHVHLYPPAQGPWTSWISRYGIVLIAVLQGAARSFASDYYKTKFCSIFELGRDESTDALRRKVLALGPDSSFFAHFEVFIGRMGHLAFEHEWFDPHKSTSSASEEHVRQILREEHSPMTRLLVALWGLSNGDAFLSMVVLSLLVNQLWVGQVFFATVGVLWIYAIVVLNGWFVRGAARRSRLAVTS